MELPPRARNLTDDRCNMLVAHTYIGNNRHGKAIWLCDCDCGTKDHPVVSCHFIARAVISCGCHRRELGRTKNLKHGHSKVGKRSPTYKSWAYMMDRCLRPDNKRFADYGGRGIAPCQRFQSFVEFLVDVGERPSPEHSLGRIENVNGYTCGRCADCETHGWIANVRWETPAQQANNTRRNVFYEYDGKRLTVPQWARTVGMKPMTLYMRLDRGETIGEALLRPVKRTNYLTAAERIWRIRARERVHDHVKRGRIPHPATLACVHCGDSAEHYHHHLGYERCHWLSVIPLCDPCHKKTE